MTIVSNTKIQKLNAYRCKIYLCKIKGLDTDSTINYNWLDIGLVHVQVFCEKFVFIEDLLADGAREGFSNYAMLCTPVSFQISLIGICTITVLRGALVWFFPCMDLKWIWIINVLKRCWNFYQNQWSSVTHPHMGLLQCISAKIFATGFTFIRPYEMK